MTDDFMDTPKNPLAAQEVVAGGAAIEMAKSEAAMMVLARMAHARKYPRDEAAAYARIMQACKRPGLAEAATYAYSRGGNKIDGPSIRLAEVLLTAWGNANADIYEVGRDDDASEMRAEVVDMETNVRFSSTFRVPHSRDTKQGKKALTDDRDVYENNANMASRRLRACILRLIPGDVVDDALAECERTLRSGGGNVPLADRAKRMIVAFAEHGVTQAMVEKKLGHKLDAVTETELARLRKVYTAIKDGFGAVADHFDVGPPGRDASSVDDLTEKLRREAPAASEATKPAETKGPRVSDPPPADDQF